jgi:hypothetical protein
MAATRHRQAEVGAVFKAGGTGACLGHAESVGRFVKAGSVLLSSEVEGVRIELIFRTEDGDRFEIRDSPADFEGHAHGAILQDGEVVAYADRRWLVHSDSTPRAGLSARRQTKRREAQTLRVYRCGTAYGSGVSALPEIMPAP